MDAAQGVPHLLEGRTAFVLGNTQYDGAAIEVDKATALTGAQAGLNCTEIRVIRERGDSAQQMKAHGRNPSRESVAMLVKPDGQEMRRQNERAR